MNDYTFTKYKDKDKVDFEVLIDEWLINTSANHAMLSLINGFESNQWRSDIFESFILNNIKEAALTKDELKSMPNQEWDIVKKSVSKLRLDDYLSEVGEIFLYGVMRHYYDAVPIVPKIFYKQNCNDYAKGADSVHIVIDEDNSWSFWLGESKFYTQLNNAIDESVKSVKSLLSDDKLKKENSIIVNLNIEDLVEDKQKDKQLIQNIKNVLSDRASLDDIKKILHIPISIIYECQDTKEAKEFNAEYKEIIKQYHKQQAALLSQKVSEELCNIPHISKIKFHIIIFPIPDIEGIRNRLKSKFEGIKQ